MKDKKTEALTMHTHSGVKIAILKVAATQNISGSEWLERLAIRELRQMRDDVNSIALLTQSELSELSERAAPEVRFSKKPCQSEQKESLEIQDNSNPVDNATQYQVPRRSAPLSEVLAVFAIGFSLMLALHTSFGLDFIKDQLADIYAAVTKGDGK